MRLGDVDPKTAPLYPAADPTDPGSGRHQLAGPEARAGLTSEDLSPRKPIKTGRGDRFLKCTQGHKDHEEQGPMTSPQKTNKAPVTNPREMEI